MSSPHIQLFNPIILAADIDSEAECVRLTKELKDLIGAVKIGPRLVVKHGADLISRLARVMPVFVDMKYYDIPSTMEAAVRASFQAGATFVTVHAQAGLEALKLMAQVEAELSKERPFQILTVSVLTSFSPQTLPTLIQKLPISEQVESLLKDAVDCGLSGFVCSPNEALMLRRTHPGSFIVTPGIRPASLQEVSQDDQARTQSAGQALKSGANALVIGRPILAAEDRRQAVKNIIHEIEVGLGS